MQQRRPQIFQTKLSVGDELVPADNVEALKCFNCGDYVDVERSRGKRTINIYIDHVTSCGEEIDLVSVDSDGTLYIDTGNQLQQIGPEYTQPIVASNPSPDNVKQIANRLREKGWEVRYKEEEDIAIIEGTHGNKYTVATGGTIHGHGPLRQIIINALKEI